MGDGGGNGGGVGGSRSALDFDDPAVMVAR
jgi:hypothetical protein